MANSCIAALLPLTSDPYYCAGYIPTTFMLMDDNGNTAEGAHVLDEGVAVAMGRSPGKCFVEQVEKKIFSVGKLAKILWKRHLPSLKEWLNSPNPAIVAASTAPRK